MSLKKKLTQFMGCISMVGVATIPLVSCSLNVEPNHNKANDDLNLHPSEPENEYGILDEKIKNKIKKIDNKTYDIESNIFSFDLKREVFIKNLDLSKKDIFPNVDKSKFITDIYIFLESIYKSSNSKVDLILENENIVFDQSFNTIEGNIKLSINNSYKIVRSIKINKEEIFIPSYSKIYFNLSIPKQTIKYDIVYNKDLKKNLLTWYIENLFVNLENGKQIHLSNFNFNNNHISQALPYNILNIFIEDEKYLNEKKFSLDEIKSVDLKNHFESHFQYNKNTILKYIGFANDIFTKLNENNTVDAFIKSLAPTIADILITAELIPSDLKEFIESAIKSNKPLTQVIQENRQNISKFILSITKDSYIDGDIINSVLNLIKPNMSEQDKNLFLNIINDELIPKKYVEPIKSTLNFIFTDKTTFELIDYLLSNVLNDALLLPQEKIIVNSISILKIFLKKESNQANYKNILDVLINEKKEITLLLKNILGFASDSEILDVLYSNNSNFDVNRLKSALEKVVIPFTQFLKEQNNYEITSNFKKNNNKDEYFYDEKTNKVTYKYEMKFIFKNKFKLELNPIYDLLPNNIKVSNNSIPFSLMRSLGYLPDYIEFGANDALEMMFHAENQYLYLHPKKEQKGYSFGYNIPYVLDTKFNMPAAFNSIFLQYKHKIFFIETIPWSFISTTVQLFMMVDYNFSGNIYINDKNWINMNYVEDIPDLNVYFKWKDLTNDQLNQLMSNIENKNSNQYSVTDKDGGSHTLTGKKPFVKEGKEQEILNLVLELGPGISLLPENKKPIIKIIPQVNGVISGFGSLASFAVKIVDVYVYFPSNDRVIDMNLSQVEKRQFSYNNTFTKSFVVG